LAAPGYSGNTRHVSGDELVRRILVVKDAAKQGKLVTAKYNIGTYAQQVKVEVCGLVPEKFWPILTNVTKAAVGYLSKVPVTAESLVEAVDTLCPPFITGVINTVCSELVAVQPFMITSGKIAESDLYTDLKSAIVGAFDNWVKENWDNLLSSHSEE
jgi:hypothetical protein